ncbi:MAG: TldD/PmbA family protein [Clostridia bacterium]|nr:TldD/PmbA family protein [Clostridia bacterium]
MKFDGFFKKAKAAGIEEAELYVSTADTLSFSLFHGEVDKYSMNESMSVIARGLVGGKFGAAACDVYNGEKEDYLVREIVRNARAIENDDPQFIFEGSPKYRKVNTFNNSLKDVPIDLKMEKLFELEKKIREADERIVDVAEVAYEEKASTTTLLNSKGLKLSQKNNYYVYYGIAVARSGEQTKTGFDLWLDNDFSTLDVDDLAEKTAKRAVSMLNGEPCESKVYPAVLDPEVVAELISVYVSSADAEEVQKKSSFFIGKLGQKVAARCVTVEDRPLDRTLFAKSFDDEGVATYNKPIIQNGVLKTYLYNLTTAAKDGVESTGNASRGVASVGVSPSYLVMRPGKLSREELFRKIGNGVYITELSGLHAGMNPQTGNFSLQSTGFLIKDGKIDRPLDMITVSGTLGKIFEDITYVGSDKKTFPMGISCPSVIVRKLTVAGK